MSISTILPLRFQRLGKLGVLPLVMFQRFRYQLNAFIKRCRGASGCFGVAKGPLPIVSSNPVERSA